MQGNANAGWSAICIHKDLLSDGATAENAQDARVSCGESLGSSGNLTRQILVSRTGNNTLRALCCALCVVCVVGVQWGGVGVCVLVLVLVCHADPPPPLTTPLLSPCVPPVCTFETSPCVPAPCPQVLHLRASCRYTRGRFETRGFSACHTTPHHTARTHHDHKNIHTRDNNNDHNTQRQGQRERQRKKKEKMQRRWKTREEKIERQEERRWKTGEEKIERQEERRWMTRIDMRREWEDERQEKMKREETRRGKMKEI